jgi:riboflavin transporter FmnP
MFFDFPIPFFPAFVRMDFSDLPALIGAFALGPVAGMLIELVKNLIHLTQTQTGGVGELANFLIGSALVLPAGLIYKYNKTRRGALVGMLSGTIVMAIFAALTNYFILIPFFSIFMPLDAIIEMCAVITPVINSLGKMILFSVVPFNLFKAAVLCFVTSISYKRLSRLIQGQ